MTCHAQYVSCRFGQMNMYVQGPYQRDRKPLVCFHMSPYSGKFYKKFQNEMSVDRMVICPDTPGYGGSDAPDNPPSIEELALSMRDMLTELEIDKVDVLGFHTGVFIATELALLCPEKVGKLILPGIPYVDAAKRPTLCENYKKPRPYFEDPDFLATKWAAAMSSKNEGWDEARKIEMFAEIMRSGDRSNWGFQAVFRYNAEQQLTQIKQPVFIPVPDEALADNSRAAAPLFQNARLVEYPELKADLFESCPDVFINAVRAFLDE